MGQPDDWTFHVSHLATVLKEGEDAIYSALKELIEHGYCKRIQNNINGKFQTVDYEINELPEEFKKRLPHRDFPDAGLPDAGNPGLLSNDPIPSIEEELKKETVCPEGAVAPIPGSQKNLDKKKTNGESLRVEKDEIIRSAIQKKMDWSLPEIEEAWEILTKYSGKVNDAWRFIEGTIANLRKKKNLDKLQSKEKKCSPTTQMPPVKVLTPEEIALRVQHSQKLFSEYLNSP
jgi:hypothetical protein